MAKGHTKSYEELVGALGRAVYFRPERRRVRELLSRDAEPLVQTKAGQFRLFDVSLNGVSFTASAKDLESFPIGEEIDVSVLIHGSPLFNGRARVARHERLPKGALVGLGVQTGILDLPAFLQKDEESRLEAELKGGYQKLLDKVPLAYREFIQRMSTFVQFYRKSLDTHEKRLRKQANGSDASVDALAQRAFDALSSVYFSLDREGSQVAAGFLNDPVALAAAKRYTELVVTPVVVDAPVLDRGFNKPSGYPGDYQMMLWYYENGLRGGSAFHKMFHRFGVAHPLAEGVRTRKDLVVDCIEREVMTSATRRMKVPFRATSLGSGPAYEVVDFANRVKEWNGTIQWSLLDQEDEALSVAYQTATNALSRSKGRGSVECLHIAFAQFLSDPNLFPPKHPQDLIYSVGLFDYLREAKAQEVIGALYNQLAPGGLLLIGNAVGPNSYFWSLEFLLDWTLLYRTRDEMKRMAAKLPSDAEINVETEPSGAYHFLTIRRR